MIVRNSWILYRTTKAPEDPELDLLAFRQEIANVYLTKNALSWNQSGSLQGTILSAKRRVKDEVRYNPGWPLPESLQEKKGVIIVVRIHEKVVQSVVLNFMTIVFMSSIVLCDT